MHVPQGLIQSEVRFL